MYSKPRYTQKLSQNDDPNQGIPDPNPNHPDTLAVAALLAKPGLLTPPEQEQLLRLMAKRLYE